MIIIETLIFGIVAVLFSLKVFLLAAAAVLLVYSLTARIRKRKTALLQSSPAYRRLDLRA